MPKRLLIITQHFWPENFRINDLVDGFLADGIVVDILCGLPNYPQGEWFSGYTAHGPLLEDYRGANLYRCREVPRKGNTSVRIFLNYISFPLTAALSIRKLPGDYDAVLCYNTSPVLMCFPAILAARKFKAPLTNYVLDLWPENLYSVLHIQNKALRRLASAVSDWHYRQADRLIAVSEGMTQRLRERVGSKNAKGCCLPEKEYAIIPQYCEDFYDYKAAQAKGAGDNPATSQGSAAVAGTDIPHTDALPQPNTAPFQIQFAGNFSPAQSLDTALEAMAIVKATYDANHTAAQSDLPPATSASQNRLSVPVTPPIQLVLIGDGMSSDALKQQAAQLALGDCVIFYGSVRAQEIPALAAQADALLIPLSASDDVGLTIPAKFASCMAAGKPLLVSMNGEGAQLARESGAALVSAAADAPALAKQMLSLAAMPLAQRSAMGEAAYAYYKAHFDRSTLLAQIEAFIF